MKKTVIAIALTGAVGAPSMALAQANPVTLYGLLNVSFEALEADGGATAALSRRNCVGTNNGQHVAENPRVSQDRLTFASDTIFPHARRFTRWY